MNSAICQYTSGIYCKVIYAYTYNLKTPPHIREYPPGHNHIHNKQLVMPSQDKAMLYHRLNAS